MMPLGRNVNEYLRMVDAYTHIQKEKFVPNWEAGKEAMSADKKYR
jgi:alkyl hydroperoxide reductase subunit AhpC